MNSFDSSIIAFFNSFAHRSYFLDSLVSMVVDNALLKGGFICALIWWAWFRRKSANLEIVVETRNYLMVGLLACLLAGVTARVLANSLPYRERPLRNPALHFQLPYEASAESLIDWSSFPSDHATVFFALALTLWFVWRPAGILAFCHVFFIICLPRLYLGIHYPTDILVGALLGILFAMLSRIAVLRNAVGKFMLPWFRRSPGSFYACFFLLTFQIATLFRSVREVGGFLYLFWKLHFSA